MAQMSGKENDVNLLREDSHEEDWSPDDCVGADKYIEIWKKGLLCDVFFEVGEEKRPFRAHRLLLAFFSTEFRTSFFGREPSSDGATEDNPKLVPDVNADAFELMLTFMNSGESSNSIQITDQVVVHLLYAAGKYRVSRLKHECVKKLTTIRPASAPWILQQSLHYNDLHIAERCCNVICKNAESFLASEGFLKCDRRALEMNIRRDDFYIEREIFLLNRLLHWTSVTCEKEEIEETLSGKRAALGNLLYLVRFPLMNDEELTEVASRDVLTKAELGELFIGKAKSTATYEHFISRERLYISGCFNGKRPSVLRRFSTFEETRQKGERYMCFSVDRKINIIGIGMTDMLNDTAEIGINDLIVSVDSDCDASKEERWMTCQLRSLERRGKVVQLMSDQFPNPVPGKRYFLWIYFKDWNKQAFYCGPKSAQDGTQTVLVRDGSPEKNEIVTFMFSGAPVFKKPVKYDPNNRFLPEIYFTL